MTGYYEYAEFTKDKAAIVIALLEDWFWAIENEEAGQRMPDLSGRRYSPEECDRLINLIDKFIEYEINSHPGYWENIGNNSKGIPIDLPADFNRLEGMAREAFTQAVYAKMLEVFGKET